MPFRSLLRLNDCVFTRIGLCDLFYKVHTRQVADEPQRLEASSCIPAPPPRYQEYIYHDFQTRASRPYYHHLVDCSTTWTPDGPFYQAIHVKDRVNNRTANDGKLELIQQRSRGLSWRMAGGKQNSENHLNNDRN